MTAADSSPMDVLRQEILADAEKQAERTRRRARRDAKAALDKAEQEAAEDRDARLAEARRRAQTMRDLVLARVPVEVRRMQAHRQEDVLRDVRDEAERRLAERDGFDYAAAVADLAAEAIRRMDGSRFVLGLSAADREALGGSLANEVRRRLGRDDLDLSIDAESADAETGVVVRDVDGRQVWDNRFAARLERMWPELRRRIACRLFQRGTTPEAEEP